MLIIKALLLSLIPVLAQANLNEVFADLLGRPPERGGWKASYEIRQYGAKPADGEKVSLRQHSVQAGFPLSSLIDRRWKLYLNGETDEIGSRARFPNGRPMPNQVWNLGSGVSYSRLTDSDRTVGGHLMLGSNSDRPFGALRDSTFESTLFYKIPEENEAAWVFFLNLSNNRGFLDYIPLPGAAYFFKPHPRLRMALGVPFILAFWSPFDGGVWSFTYYPVYSAQTKFSYFIFGPAHVFVQAKYHSKNYRLWDRADKKERFFYDEAVASGGFSMPLERNWMVEGSAGLSFERKFFLGEDSTDWKSGGQVIRPARAPFAALKLIATF